MCKRPSASFAARLFHHGPASQHGFPPPRQFWQEETEHTPAARFEMHKRQEGFKRAEELKKNPPKPKRERRFFHGANWEFIYHQHLRDVCLVNNTVLFL
jgi:hypothetical protein